MNILERFSRSRFVLGALVETPIKSLQVREGQAALAKATAELTEARLQHDRAREAARESSAKVRDATARASAECKKGRAALVAKGIALAPHAVSDGQTAREVLARAEFLIGSASVRGFKLDDLAASRDELSAKLVDRAMARRERDAAGELLDGASLEWDDAYAALRAVVEIELRKSNVRGRALKRRLEEYFPKGIAKPEKKPAAKPATPAGPVKPQTPGLDKPAA